MDHARKPYLFADWFAGVPMPHGWDSADAVDDGWTGDNLTEWMRYYVAEDMSPLPAAKPAPAMPRPVPAAVVAAAPVAAVQPRAVARQWPGAGGVANMPQHTTVGIGSEVDVAQLLAVDIRENCGQNAVYADAKFWAFGPTDWRPIDDHRLRMKVHGFDGAVLTRTKTETFLKVGKRMIDGVLAETGTILYQPKFFDDPAVGLNAQNCVITIDINGVIGTRPHDPDDRFRFTIEADFDLNTEMVPPDGSMLRRLLDGAFGGDPDANEKIALVGEILGAAAFGMATRIPQPKAFVFHGETASNGKSTVASLLSILLPAGSVSSITPASFSDPARIVNLAGKAANVADEISGAVSGEQFKAAITGNPIEGRDLYRSAMTFVPRAIHVFTTNKLPTFTGGLDRGLQRRLVVLTFNRVIKASEIIPDIIDRIKRDELDLLLGFAIAGAMRLVKNRGYTLPKSSTEALRTWLMLDPVNEWFEARCKLATSEPAGGWPTTRLLFIDFKAWATHEGHAERHLPPVNTFSQRLKSVLGVSIKRGSASTVAVGVSCDFSAPLSSS